MICKNLTLKIFLVFIIESNTYKKNPTEIICIKNVNSTRKKFPTNKLILLNEYKIDIIVVEINSVTKIIYLLLISLIIYYPHNACNSLFSIHEAIM